MSEAQRPTTLCEAFQLTASIDPDAVALRTAGGGPNLTWAQYAEQVRAVTAGLSGLGVSRGDTVSLMMANRVEFYPLEVGAQHVGATSFSVYNTLPPADLAHVFGNAGTKVVMCEAQFVDRIRASGAPIEHIVVIDGAVDGTISVGELLAAAPTDFDFEATWRAVRPDDILTLIYTSGTTGKPKGVEMTHANILFESFAVDDVLGIRFGDRGTSYLPTAHIADRLTGLYFQEVFGTQLTTVADVRAIAAALPEVRPTVWGGVPRVWEKLKAAVEFAAANEPDEMKRAALQWALSVGAKKAAPLLAHQPVPDDVAAEWATADELVLSKLRERLGLDQVRWAVSGAAPIPVQTLGFFVGLGIPMTELWGMSELSCIATVSHPRDTKLGTVGRPLPGVECRLADDGELLVRAPLVMKGYRKEPAKTAEALDPDGWLHTGDVARIDDEGYLTIIDRKKELIINAAGKNMSPANIEKSIKAACPLIGVVMAIGDARPYNTALIVLDAESAGPYAAQRGLADASPAALAADPELIAQIAAGVAEGNAELSRVEQIKRFSVLPAFWEPGGDEITLTMKLKRRPVVEKYAAEIEALYEAEPGPTVHEPKVTVAAPN